MKTGAVFNHSTLLKLGEFILITLIFSLAYTQEPIYNSPETADGNQNTKFFQGLARAGWGLLDQDWLASTIDPLPAFTFLVEFSYKYIHPAYGFYLYYAILMGIYVFSLLSIVSYVFKIKKNKYKYLLYLAIFLFIHTVNIEIFEFDTAWHLHAGVAQQYILGPVFQPCNFGVFLLLSIVSFLYDNDRPFWAVISLAIAATFHPTYLPSITVLTLSYMFCIWQEEKNFKKAFFVGLLSFILVLPVFCYMYFNFQATSPELKAQATDIIVNFRIPHHSLTEVWLAKGRAQVQTIIVIIALYLVRKTKLFTILVIPFLVALSLTIAQIYIENNTIAFIAPWRISVFLVPIATSVIIASLVSWIWRKWAEKKTKIKQIVLVISLAIVTVLVILGTNKQIALFQYYDNSTPMLNFVRQTRQPEYTYLVPPDYKRLQKFRLYTGAPIFINKKSHPYKDTEVIEWYKRVQLALQIYSNTPNSCPLLENLATNEGVTHVVMELNKYVFGCNYLLQEVYRDKKYGVYRIQLDEIAQQ